jgi:Lar family restriction alleviation protein
MTDKLKSCPFCGSPADTHKHPLQETWSASCLSCSATMPYVGLTEAKAIAAWNTRNGDHDDR